MEMAHSVEGRLPFLDHKVVEFCRQIPVSLKIHEGVEKYVLREAAKDQLTKNVYRNRKHSFMAPPVGNMREPLARQRMKEIFGASDFERYTFFNQRELLAWIDQVKDPSEYISMEPVLMMALTSYALGCGYLLIRQYKKKLSLLPKRSIKNSAMENTSPFSCLTDTMSQMKSLNSSGLQTSVR